MTGSPHSIWVPLLDEEENPEHGNDTALGRAARQHNRSQSAMRARRKLLELIEREAAPLLEGKLPLDHTQAIERILGAIEAGEIPGTQASLLHNYFCAGLARGNSKGLWCIPVPSMFATVAREQPSRDEKYFLRGNIFQDTRLQFIKALERLDLLEERWNRDGTETKSLSDNRAILIYLSATLFGGLCDHLFAARLPTTLANEGLQIQNGMAWLDMSVPASLIRAANVAGHDLMCQRWFLDDFTLLLVRHRQTRQPNIWPDWSTDKTAGSNAATPERWLIEKFRTLFQEMQIPWPGKVNNLRDWCRGAWAAAERQRGADIPGYLGLYAMGDNLSYSLPPDRWLRLLDGQTSTVTQAISLPPAQDIPPEQVTLRKGKAANPDLNPIASVLLQTVRPGPFKVTQGAAASKLEEAANGPALDNVVVGQLLGHWGAFLLRSGKGRGKSGLAVSTVYKDYLSPLVRPLLSFCGSMDLTEFDPAEFEELYDDVMSSASQRYPARTGWAIDSFHRFLVVHFACEELETTYSRGGSRFRRVRALILSEEEFQESRSRLLKMHADSQNIGEQLDWMLVLGFRAGLRISEVIKLRLVDFFVAEDVTMTIQTNRYGSNKGKAEPRRIDLKSLCRVEEFQAIKTRLRELQAQKAPSPGALLFSPSVACTQPWQLNELRQILQPVLREVTGNPHVIFHTLRHSAITKMVLTIESPELALRLWGADAAIPLKAANLTGKAEVSFKRLHAVAERAGHSSPQRTLDTYLHLLDLLLLEKVRKSLPEVSSDMIAYLLQVSKSSVERRFRRSRTLSPGAPGVFRTRALRDLQPGAQKKKKTRTAKSIPMGRTRKIDARLILEICEIYDRGDRLSDIATHLDLPEDQIQKIIASAEKVAQIKTRRNRPRLVTQQRLKSNHSASTRPLISPARPMDAADQRLADSMIDRIRLAYSKRPEPVANCVEYFLSHVEAGNSGVAFYDLDAAKKFANLLWSITDQKEQVVGIHQHWCDEKISSEVQRDWWRKHLKLEVIEPSGKECLKKAKQSRGKLFMTVVVDPKTLFNKNWSSAHSYKFALHIFSIALMASGKISLPER